ncbi:MAG: aminopeptidase P family protein [Candidatus Omnitrophota bacterium]
MTNRLIALGKRLQKESLKALLVSKPANIYYLSGFTSPDALLLITPFARFIITDARYKEEAQELKGFELRLIDKTYHDSIVQIVRETGIKNVGFESEDLTYGRVARLSRSLKKGGVSMRATVGLTEDLRALKEPAEIRSIKAAVGAAQKAFAALRIVPGMTEKEVARRLDERMIAAGAQGSAFTTIVASGKNASRPHAITTDRRISRNEPVVIDFGARAGMYNCDLTRVKVLGKIQGTLRDIFSIVREAQQRAIAGVRPGMRARDIDKIARDFIASRGYGGSFGHALGHGVGIEVHEAPRISATSPDTLQPGMVITIEPGIYLERIGGVRLEDMLRITETGYEVLTDDIPQRDQ